MYIIIGCGGIIESKFEIIESEFPNSSIQCDVYIFQLICLSASYVRIFAILFNNLKEHMVLFYLIVSTPVESF